MNNIVAVWRHLGEICTPTPRCWCTSNKMKPKWLTVDIGPNVKVALTLQKSLIQSCWMNTNCPWWLFTLSLSFQALRSFLIFSLHLWNESHQVLRLLGLFSPRPNWWADLPKSLDFSHIIIIIMGVVFSLPLEKDQDEEGPQFNGGKERQAAHFEEYLDVVTRCCCLLWFGFIGSSQTNPSSGLSVILIAQAQFGSLVILFSFTKMLKRQKKKRISSHSRP